MVVRSYDDEMQYLERLSPHCWRIKKGFQPNMKAGSSHHSYLFVTNLTKTPD